MLYPSPHTLLGHCANGGSALLVGIAFALIGLNAASGCGQSGGSCIGIGDFANPPAELSRQIDHHGRLYNHHQREGAWG